MTNINERLTSTLIILIETFNSGILIQIANSISCEQMNDKLVLSQNLSIDCEDENFLKFKNYLFLPMFIVFGFGPPIAYFIAIFIQRKNIKTLKYRIKFGFLTNGYKQDYLYW